MVASTTVGELRIDLVNEFCVGGVPSGLTTPAQRLVAFLAVNDHPVARRRAAFALWPDVTEARAAASLRTAVWSMRDGAGRLVDQRGGRLALATGVTVDIHESRSAAYSLPADLTDTIVAVLTRAFSGELLPGWYDAWLDAPRDRWNAIRLHALDSLSGRLVADGRFLPAIEVAIEAVSIDPFRETSRRTLIAAYVAEGNVAMAIKEFAAFRSTLKRDLGVEPSDELTALVPHSRPLGRAGPNTKSGSPKTAAAVRIAPSAAVPWVVAGGSTETGWMRRMNGPAGVSTRRQSESPGSIAPSAGAARKENTRLPVQHPLAPNRGEGACLVRPRPYGEGDDVTAAPGSRPR